MSMRIMADKRKSLPAVHNTFKSILTKFQQGKCGAAGTTGNINRQTALSCRQPSSRGAFHEAEEGPKAVSCDPDHINSEF
jgi:hypothetical protein